VEIGKCLGRSERDGALKTLCKNFAAYLRWIFNIAPSTRHIEKRREKNQRALEQKKKEEKLEGK